MDKADLALLKSQLFISKQRARQLESSLDRLSRMIDEIQEKIYTEEDKFFDYYLASKEA